MKESRGISSESLGETSRPTEETRQFLADLFDRIHVLPDPKTLLHMAAAGVGARLNVAFCAFAVMDPQREVVLSQYGPTDKSHAGSILDLPRALGRNVVDALRLGQTVVLNDTARDLIAADAPVRVFFPTGGLLAQPLVHSGSWIATLIVVSASPRVWQPDEIFVVRSVAAQAAMAVQNLRLAQDQEKVRHEVLAAARCLLWQADITESGHPTMLHWETHFVDAAAAREWLPIEVRPGEEYLNARRRARFPEELEANDATGTAAIRAGESYSQEFRCRCADGSLRWLHEDIQVVTVVPGQRWQTVGVCTDVTERVRSEEAQRSSELRLHEALQAGKMGTWEWDMVTNALIWSAETERLFGLPVGAFAGTYQAYQRFLHPEDREVVQELITKAIYNRSPYDSEHRIVLQNGAVRWIGGKGQAFYDQQGRPIRMLGTVADITDRKRLEQQVLQVQKMDSIGRLAGGVAHDFNNFLCVILLFAELVEMELAEDSPLLTNVRHIQDAATRANNLTSQLLAFARRQVSAAKVVFPNEVITEMSRILTPLIGEDIELTTLLKADVGSIKADPSQIEQVLVNLVVNARDAIVGGGKISIRTDNATLTGHFPGEEMTVVPGEYVLIMVSDTGTGLTEEAKRHLFEPFFTTKGMGRGTGLGLATVYGIVKQNNGYILFDGDDGGGTTARVYLPRVFEAPFELGTGAGADIGLHGTATILVVEDEQLVRGGMVTILRGHGYTVLEARNGVEALQIAAAQSGKLDLLVTDAIMPEMGGKELADRLRDARPSIRLMYVSGYTEETTAQNFLQKGAALLQKPFTVGQLLTTVRAALEGDPRTEPTSL